MYNWTVTNLKYFPDLQGQTNFVYVVEWAVNVTDSDVSETGKTFLTLESESFVQWEDLDQDTVLGWVFDAIGDEEKEATELRAVEKAREAHLSQGTPWSN